MNQSDLVFGILGVVGIVIIAMALSGTTHELAVVIQAGLFIAILALLVRSNSTIPNAIQNVEKLAIGATGKTASA